jgi:hypothetical protein
MPVYVIVNDSDWNINYLPAVPHECSDIINTQAELAGWFIGGTSSCTKQSRLNRH